MSLSVKNLLLQYYSVDDLKDSLDLIGEPVSGTKNVLVNRILQTWTGHRRDLKDLLDVLEAEKLAYICQDYNVDNTGSKSALIRRILSSEIIESFNSYKIPSSKVDASQYIIGKGSPQEKPDVVEEKTRIRPRESVGNRNIKYYVMGGIGVTVLVTTLLLNTLGIFDRLVPPSPELTVDVTSSTVRLIADVQPNLMRVESELPDKEIEKDVTIVINNIGEKAVKDVYLNMTETPRDQGWFNYHSKEVLEGYAEDTGDGDLSYQGALNANSKIRIKYHFSIVPDLYSKVKDDDPKIGFYVTYDGDKRESREFVVCYDKCPGLQ